MSGEDVSMSDIETVHNLLDDNVAGRAMSQSQAHRTLKYVVDLETSIAASQAREEEAIAAREGWQALWEKASMSVFTLQDDLRVAQARAEMLRRHVVEILKDDLAEETMSAECDVCGTDLSYSDDWPEMHCEPCQLRAELLTSQAREEELRVEVITRLDHLHKLDHSLADQAQAREEELTTEAKRLVEKWMARADEHPSWTPEEREAFRFAASELSDLVAPPIAERADGVVYQQDSSGGMHP